MVAGLSFRAIVELINSNNESGLKSFLDTQHANIDDKNEVKVAKYSELKNFKYLFNFSSKHHTIYPMII